MKLNKTLNFTPKRFLWYKAQALESRVCYQRFVCPLFPFADYKIMNIYYKVGKEIFTLPICLRPPGAAGFPRADEGVSKYFSDINNSDSTGFKAHRSIATFIAAAHHQMLISLKKLKEEGRDPSGLRHRWHELMEPNGRALTPTKFRKDFYKKVIAEANDVRVTFIYFWIPNL